MQGFTYPVRARFLEDILEMTGYKITSFNQIDDYGQEKLWKTQKQLAPRKRKNQITTLVEVGFLLNVHYGTNSDNHTVLCTSICYPVA